MAPAGNARRAHRALAPWVQENPILMHVRSAEPDAVKTAIDQCAEVGFEMVIMTFGSGFDIENENPGYLAQIKALADYARRAAQAPAVSPAVVSLKGRALLEKILARAAQHAAGKALNEVQSKQLLKAYGIAGPKEAVAHSATQAVAIAKRIGFPVVAKGVSAALPHKSDAGAVLVGLSSVKAVRAAYEQIVEAVIRHSGGAPHHEPQGVKGCAAVNIER